MFPYALMSERERGWGYISGNKRKLWMCPITSNTKGHLCQTPTPGNTWVFSQEPDEIIPLPIGSVTVGI